ncbi:ABC transporter permease [Halopiger thermotolerans]
MSREQGPNPPALEGGPEQSEGASWRARLALVRRELGSLRSEKTILLAIAIQLFIAAFSSFLVVGLVSLYDPGAVDGYRTEVAVTGDGADDLVEVAARQDGLSAARFDAANAQRAFDRGDVAAVLRTSRTDEGQLFVHVTAPEEGLETTLLVVQLRDALEELERAERVANAEAGRLTETPLSVPSAIGASPYVGFTYTVLLPLLCFLPVFISGSIVVDSLIEERDRGTLALLRVAPLSLTEIVDAKVAATAALAPLQAVAWMVLLAVNGTTIANPTALVALVAALALLVVGGGAIVALSAPDRRQAQLLYSIGVVGALVVASLLPEHPANTVAKFAMDSATGTSWLLLAGYCLAGIAAVVALRRTVGGLETDAL